jgi:ribosomal protein L7/L12
MQRSNLSAKVRTSSNCLYGTNATVCLSAGDPPTKMKNETVITVNDLPSDVIEAIKEGRKIEAIKRLRIATGLGLANAKVLVDAAARKHGMQTVYPDMVDSPTGTSATLKIAFVLLLGLIVWQFFLK